MNRYSNKRHRRPGKPHKKRWISTKQDHNGLWHHIVIEELSYGVSARSFWLHPTKGWRSSGPR